jgi:MFS family permease
MQQVLHYSALQTGAAYITFTLAIIIFSGVSQAVVTRVGIRRILPTGMLVATGALLLYTRLPVNGHYFWDLFPAFLIGGIGMAFVFVPMSIGALAGVGRRDAGVASGLLNTSQQIGGAIGTAIASTIFITHFKSLRSEGKSVLEALTGGYAWAFWGLAVIGVLALIAALTLIRREEMAETAAAPVA